MPTFTILAPDGKKYKVSGPNREGAIRALNDKLNPQPKNNNTGINSPTGGYQRGFIARYRLIFGRYGYDCKSSWL